MFTVNFYLSCFDSREDSTRKKTYKTRLEKGCLPACIYASEYPDVGGDLMLPSDNFLNFHAMIV